MWMLLNTNSLEENVKWTKFYSLINIENRSQPKFNISILLFNLSILLFIIIIFLKIQRLQNLINNIIQNNSTTALLLHGFRVAKNRGSSTSKSTDMKPNIDALFPQIHAASQPSILTLINPRHPFLDVTSPDPLCRRSGRRHDLLLLLGIKVEYKT